VYIPSLPSRRRTWKTWTSRINVWVTAMFNHTMRASGEMASSAARLVSTPPARAARWLPEWASHLIVRTRRSGPAAGRWGGLVRHVAHRTQLRQSNGSDCRRNIEGGPGISGAPPPALRNESLFQQLPVGTSLLYRRNISVEATGTKNA